MILLDLALDTLATARLTRLVATDIITEPARGRVIEWAYAHADGPPPEFPDDTAQGAYRWSEVVEDDPDPPKLAVLVTCQWCAGVWIAGGVMLVRRRRWWRWLRVPLAMSMVTGLLAENLE